jgi:hypothetical protein
MIFELMSWYRDHGTETSLNDIEICIASKLDCGKPIPLLGNEPKSGTDIE